MTATTSATDAWTPWGDSSTEQTPLNSQYSPCNRCYIWQNIHIYLLNLSPLIWTSWQLHSVLKWTEMMVGPLMIEARKTFDGEKKPTIKCKQSSQRAVSTPGGTVMWRRVAERARVLLMRLIGGRWGWSRRWQKAGTDAIFVRTDLHPQFIPYL